MAVLFFGTPVLAQTFPPLSSCTSKDLELVGASLPAPANDPCQCSGTRTLILTIYNKTGSTRTSFALWGTLVRYNAAGTEISREPIVACAGPIPKNSTTPLVSDKQITISCGESLDIIDLYLAWTSASPGETCSVLKANPSTINPKCGTLPLIHVGIGVDATIVTTNANCTGGSVKVTPFGGVGPYTVALDGGTGVNVAAGSFTTFTNVAAGNHNVVITDNRSCSTIKTPSVAADDPVVADAGANFTKTCTQNASGKQIGEASQSGFSYSWSPSDGLSATNVSNPTANPTSTTTYTVTKTNTATGCFDTDEIEVTVNNAAVTAVAGNDFTKNCIENINGKTIGEANDAAFSYSWSPATDLTATNVSNPTANPSSTTTYTVTKTNTTTGCFDTDEIEVTVNNAVVTANAGSDFTKNCVSNINGSQVGEASQAGFSYSWLPTAGLSDPAISNPVANPSSTTTYTVTKTNTSSGCYDTDEVEVTVSTGAVTADAGSDFTITCAENINGKAIGEASDAAFSYSWSPAAGLSAPNISNPTANPSSTTTYTVTKTNTTTGCFDTDEITVTVNTLAPSFTVCLVQPDLCNQYGSVTFSASGGSDYRYSIDGGTDFTNTTGIFNNLVSGSVTNFKVKSANGCIATLSCDAASNCPSNAARMNTNTYQTQEQQIVVEEPAKITAYPNPFNDRVKFVVTSAVSGRGNLEVFNMLGQKVKTVYQGNIVAGTQTFELMLPKQQLSNLIYVFRVGDKRISGKLLQLKQ